MKSFNTVTLALSAVLALWWVTALNQTKTPKSPESPESQKAIKESVVRITEWPQNPSTLSQIIPTSNNHEHISIVSIPEGNTLSSLPLNTQTQEIPALQEIPAPQVIQSYESTQRSMPKTWWELQKFLEESLSEKYPKIYAFISNMSIFTSYFKKDMITEGDIIELAQEFDMARSVLQSFANDPELFEKYKSTKIFKLYLTEEVSFPMMSEIENYYKLMELQKQNPTEYALLLNDPQFNKFTQSWEGFHATNAMYVKGKINIAQESLKFYPEIIKQLESMGSNDPTIDIFYNLKLNNGVGIRSVISAIVRDIKNE